MGLTIHYELALPRETPVKQARATVEALRQRCLDLPFQHLGPLIDLEGSACNFEINKDEDLRWLLIQGGKAMVPYHLTSKDIPRRGHARKDATGSANRYGRVIAERLIAFTAQPGEGCEPANLGLALFPEHLDAESEKHPFHRRKIPVPGAQNWSWSSFCKTQYANDPRLGGLHNFLRCHLLVVAALDAARKQGIKVKVSDEGDYWATRNVDALGNAVGALDAAIAGFRGALKDAVGENLVTAMDGRPDTERLEAKGRTKEMEVLAELLRQTMRGRKR
ncbi:MAG: hypothetical protein M5U26_11765 [Planctomycetota bacterium]|nr:hypothetical protein [Planctomycetota bacterium]